MTSPESHDARCANHWGVVANHHMGDPPFARRIWFNDCSFAILATLPVNLKSSLWPPTESSIRHAHRTGRIGNEGRATSINAGCMTGAGCRTEANVFLFLKKAPNSSERPHPKVFSSPRTAGKRRRIRGRVIRPERSGGVGQRCNGANCQ